MRILTVASEATPYAKTGGLADVIGSLPFALAARGQEVAVVLPLYRSSYGAAATAERVYDRMSIYVRPGVTYEVDIRRLTDRGVSIYFVESPALFHRDQLYGERGQDYPDNHIRYLVFCRAVLGIIRSLFRPDIVHCHDWQAALVGPLLRYKFRLDPTFAALRILLTIHNLGYQGVFASQALDEMGLSRGLFYSGQMEYWGRINLLKGGIVFADAISTVSRAYASEIQTPEYGFGLEGLLQTRADVLTGIVNGVDYEEWSPETDTWIAKRYSAGNLAGKHACKADLLQSFGLPDSDLQRPVIGIVSRFVGQKGFDLVEEIGPALMQQDVTLVAIGSGEPRYEQALLSLAQRFPGRVAVRIAYDNARAHKIEAGADIFLMPSRYEPCGLNQIYSLRYGTVPVVRATGGLDDTIDGETGFKFEEYSGPALLTAIKAALAAYREPDRWRKMMMTGMNRDFSWGASATEYISLYRQMLET